VSDELAADQVAYCHELADDRRGNWASHGAAVECLAEKLQQYWQGGGHAYTRPWNNGTDKDCVHGLPGQAEFFRQLARIAIASVPRL
jgi:hypothetical protein